MNHLNMQRNKFPFLKLACAWVIVLTMTQALHAQNYTGSWHRVPMPFNSLILEFGFADSLHGVCLSGNEDISSTSDGGRSWIRDTSLNLYFGPKRYLDGLECIGDRRAFWFPSEGSLSIAPPGCDFIYPPYGGDNGFGTYTTLSEKMYNTSYGFRLVEQMSTVPGFYQALEDSISILVTHDGWQHSMVTGSTYTFPSPPSGTQVFNSGLLVDSNEAWTAELNVVLHTSNRGATWTSMLPADTSRYNPNWISFFAKPQTREVWTKPSFGPIDIAYSSDYGSTWRLDSTFVNRADVLSGTRLWRLCPTASGAIWALIGNDGGGDVTIDPRLYTKLYPHAFSNKIAISSDKGFSWGVDSLTFLADSLVEMHFLDSRHGWVASWSHDSSFIWYYDANASGVENTGSNVFNGISVYPNPANSFIMVTYFSEPLAIVDPLGRNYKLPRTGTILDISSLPPGVYFMSDGHLHSKFVKE